MRRTSSGKLNKAQIDVRDGKTRPEATLGRIVLSWGSHFPMTPQDALTAAEAACKANSAGAISRQAAARYLGRFFGVEDVEADQESVERDEQRQDQRAQEFDVRANFAAGMDEFG